MDRMLDPALDVGNGAPCVALIPSSIERFGNDAELVWRRTFRSIGIAAILILITIGMTPVGLMAAAPLENRFPQPAADMPPPFGILVLGGAVNGLVSKARGEIVLDEGERMIEAACLAKRYPQARVVFTGGSGSLIAESKEAPAARQLLIELGVDPARIIVEDKSRNTEENAQFTAAIVRPEPKQRWLLVTSAFHMPRAIGVFEKAGFDVVPDPVAYRTLGPGNGWRSRGPGLLEAWECAARSVARHRQAQPRPT
ncbi:MAG TPA: YdcF family protein [Roseiarcus sp.]|nr:YdcF family protein [Roseiarcus sp.]